MRADPKQKACQIHRDVWQLFRVNCLPNCCDYHDSWQWSGERMFLSKSDWRKEWTRRTPTKFWSYTSNKWSPDLLSLIGETILGTLIQIHKIHHFWWNRFGHASLFLHWKTFKGRTGTLPYFKWEDPSKTLNWSHGLCKEKSKHNLVFSSSLQTNLIRKA